VRRRRHQETSAEGQAFKAIFDKFSQEDRPVSFGPGATWVATPTDRPKLVAELLDAVVGPSRWMTGVGLAGDDDRIYVTPTVDGWVLVPGYRANDDDLAVLGQRLGVAQSFMADAAHGKLRWALCRGTDVVRRVDVRWPVDGDGEGGNGGGGNGGGGNGGGGNGGAGAPAPPAVEVVTRGALTEAERVAGVPEDLPAAVGSGAVVADNALVLAVAGQWSIDPSTFDDRDEPAGPGWLGRVVHLPVTSALY